MMNYTKDNFSISTDKDRIDIDYVHRFLSSSYWAENIPRDVVRRSISSPPDQNIPYPGDMECLT